MARKPTKKKKVESDKPQLPKPKPGEVRLVLENPRAKTQRDKCAIVGWASSSRELAPFNDDTWDIWGCNQLGQTMPGKRWDCHFDIHERWEIDAYDEERKKWQRKRKEPVYMIQKFRDFPTSQEFPWLAILELTCRRALNADGSDVVSAKQCLNAWKRKDIPKFVELCKKRYPQDMYFTSTIAWIFAFAMICGYKEIGIWGVDMSTLEGFSEYQWQKGCCEHWLGFARGKGINTFIPPESLLLKSLFVYGLESPKEIEGPLAPGFLGQQAAELNKKHTQAAETMWKLRGAMEQTQFLNHLATSRERSLPLEHMRGEYNREVDADAKSQSAGAA